MPTVVPSFVAKVARAKKHLVELDEAVEAFAATEPYAVRTRIEGKKKRKVRRLVLTGDPGNTEIPIIAADVIYNLRSSLDHLMSAMVARKARSSTMFPIYFEGVWEPAVPGENQQRTKQRMRWASDVKTLSDEAVAVLKGMQAPDSDGQFSEPIALPLLNRLSNRDRHEKLPVITAAMRDVRIEFTKSDGSVQAGSADPDPDYVAQNEAEITDIPEDAVDVKVKGTPLVGITLTRPDKIYWYAEIPSNLEIITEVIEDGVIPKLLPFVR